MASAEVSAVIMIGEIRSRAPRHCTRVLLRPPYAGFRDGELSFTADGHGRHYHGKYYSKISGLLRVLHIGVINAPL
jgi:hypothetical protein